MRPSVNSTLNLNLSFWSSKYNCKHFFIVFEWTLKSAVVNTVVMQHDINKEWTSTVSQVSQSMQLLIDLISLVGWFVWLVDIWRFKTISQRLVHRIFQTRKMALLLYDPRRELLCKSLNPTTLRGFFVSGPDLQYWLLFNFIYSQLYPHSNARFNLALGVYVKRNIHTAKEHRKPVHLLIKITTQRMKLSFLFQNN